MFYTGNKNYENFCLFKKKDHFVTQEIINKEYTYKLQFSNRVISGEVFHRKYL